MSKFFMKCKKDWNGQRQCNIKWFNTIIVIGLFMFLIVELLSSGQQPPQ
jgi:hypothetical protein